MFGDRQLLSKAQAAHQVASCHSCWTQITCHWAHQGVHLYRTIHRNWHSKMNLKDFLGFTAASIEIVPENTFYWEIFTFTFTTVSLKCKIGKDPKYQFKKTLELFALVVLHLTLFLILCSKLSNTGYFY